MKLFLSLDKPLSFIKVYTTGPKASIDRIVVISITKLFTDGTTKTGTRVVNPEMPITHMPHGIKEEDVKAAPPFYNIAAKLHEFIGDSDIAGFGIYHDLSFLMEEFSRAGLSFDCFARKVIDLEAIYLKMHPRTFSAAMNDYCAEKVGMQSAEEHNTSSVKMLEAMVKKHAGQKIYKKDKEVELKADVNSLSDAFGDAESRIDLRGYLLRSGENVVFNFGKKHKGMILNHLVEKDPEYVTWLLKSADIPVDTKNIIQSFVKKSQSVAQ